MPLTGKPALRCAVELPVLGGAPVTHRSSASRGGVRGGLAGPLPARLLARVRGQDHARRDAGLSGPLRPALVAVRHERQVEVRRGETGLRQECLVARQGAVVAGRGDRRSAQPPQRGGDRVPVGVGGSRLAVAKGGEGLAGGLRIQVGEGERRAGAQYAVDLAGQVRESAVVRVGAVDQAADDRVDVAVPDPVQGPAVEQPVGDAGGGAGRRGRSPAWRRRGRFRARCSRGPRPGVRRGLRCRSRRRGRPGRCCRPGRGAAAPPGRSAHGRVSCRGPGRRRPPAPCPRAGAGGVRSREGLSGGGCCRDPRPGRDGRAAPCSSGFVGPGSRAMPSAGEAGCRCPPPPRSRTNSIISATIVTLFGVERVSWRWLLFPRAAPAVFVGGGGDHGGCLQAEVIGTGTVVADAEAANAPGPVENETTAVAAAWAGRTAPVAAIEEI